MKTAICILVILAAIPCRARTITVDDDAPADFNNIQAAIDDANDGDTVVVRAGLYYGPVEFSGKDIRLTSDNPDNSEIVRSTVIVEDSFRHYPAVIFRGDETPACIITGFKIKGSLATLDSRDAMPKQANTHATIVSCLVEPGGCGSAILDCSGTISNSIIVQTPIFDCCALEYPALLRCHGTIKNCTIVGGALEFWDSAVICSSIIYTDCSDHKQIVLRNAGTLDISYSHLTNGPGAIQVTDSNGAVNWGPGNETADPCFVQVGYWLWIYPDPIYREGDYHLKSQAGRWDPTEEGWTTDDVTSPCIDVGDPMAPIGQEPFPNGGRINMGAYGGTEEASKSYFAKPPCETIMAGDINGDCEVDFDDFRLMALHWCEDNNP